MRETDVAPGCGSLIAIGDRFLEGLESAPGLKYAVIEGMGYSYADTVELLAELLTSGAPRSETRVEKFAARFFFGEGIEALPRFRALSEIACKAARRLGLVGAGKPLPEPFPFYGEDGVAEHEWLHYVAHLGRSRAGAAFAPVTGPLRVEREPAPTIWLPTRPTGSGIMRGAMPGRETEWDDLLRAVEGRGVHVKVDDEHFVSATIFEVSLWHTSSDALAVLAAPIDDNTEERPPKPAPTLDDLEGADAAIAKVLLGSTVPVPGKKLAEEAGYTYGYVRERFEEGMPLLALGFHSVKRKGYSKPAAV